MENIWGMFLLIPAFLFYMLPAIIADNRNHQATNGITFLNLILGWSGIVWVVCFIWAFTGEENNA